MDNDYKEEMSKEQYLEEIIKMLSAVNDNRILKYFYIFITEKIKRAQ